MAEWGWFGDGLVVGGDTSARFFGFIYMYPCVFWNVLVVLDFLLWDMKQDYMLWFPEFWTWLWNCMLLWT